MKLVLLIRSLNTGGTETQVANLARGLHDKGVDFRIIVFYPGGTIEKELIFNGIQINHLNKKGRWDLIGWFSRFLRLLHQYRPDVVYSFLTEANLSALAAKLFLPKIHVVWSIRAATSDSEIRKGDLFVSVAFQLAKVLSRFPSKIIANSYDGMRFHAKCGFYSNKMMVIPNGIDIKLFRQAPESGRRLREDLEIPLNVPLIGIVARLDPIKNHKMFLESAALLVKKNENVRFLIVGDGELKYRQVLEKTAGDLELSQRVTWLPNAKNMVGIYNALTITTLCSFSEAFPNVIAESMACGTLCVVTDMGDTKQILQNTGQIIGSFYPEDLVRGWEKLLCVSIKELGEQKDIARTHICESYSNEIMVKKTLDLCEKLILNI